MKITKVLKVFILLFTILFLVSTASFAAYSDVQMSVEKEPVTRLYFTDNSYFEKKLVEKDLQNKEVTIQLSVVNNELPDKPTGELVLVVDNSNSMIENKVDDKTRLEVVRSSAQKFVSNLLDGNTDLKISVVSFSSNPTIDSQGKSSKEGTEEDAQLVHTLSNDATELNKSIQGIQSYGPRTDLDAGLTLANKQFSETSNQKYIVVLSDGVPNLAIGHNNFPFDYQEVIDTTKATLKSIDDNGVFLINMLTGVSDTTSTPPGFSKTYGQIVEEIFGTPENPSYGEFFNITDDKIEETVTEKIVEKLAPIFKTLKDIKVKDVFPDYIVQNFDFSYVKEATHGDISASIDTSDNSITWTIPELKAGETAVVQYKLKLKEGYDPKILDQLLNTNEKVDLSYTDFDGSTKTQTTTESPQLKLTEPAKAIPPAETPNVSPIPLPAAGSVGLVVGAVSAIILAVFLFIKNKNLKDIK